MGRGFGMPRYRETEENESSAIGTYYGSSCTVLVNFYSTVVTAYRPLPPHLRPSPPLPTPGGVGALCSLPNPLIRAPLPRRPRYRLMLHDARVRMH